MVVPCGKAFMLCVKLPSPVDEIILLCKTVGLNAVDQTNPFSIIGTLPVDVITALSTAVFVITEEILVADISGGETVVVKEYILPRVVP